MASAGRPVAHRPRSGTVADRHLVLQAMEQWKQESRVSRRCNHVQCHVVWLCLGIFLCYNYRCFPIFSATHDSKKLVHSFGGGTYNIDLENDAFSSGGRPMEAGGMDMFQMLLITLKGTELTDPPPVDGHLEILQRPALVEIRGACKTQNAGP